jgi:hypothetical protein
MASYDELLSTANNYVAGYNPNEQVNLNDSRLTTIENQRMCPLIKTQKSHPFGRLIACHSFLILVFV